MPRLRMIAPASDVIERANDVHRSTDPIIEPLGTAESVAASVVLVEAYLSSDDSMSDDGEQLDLFWAGEWGPPIPEATKCARWTADGEIVGLSLVCSFEQLPLVAHLVVAETARRRGVAGALLASSARGLRAVGIDTVELAVDAKNRAALHLYARLGFRLAAPGCLYRDSDGLPSIRYRETPTVDGLRDAFLASMPELEPNPDYIVGVRDPRTEQCSFPSLDNSVGRPLPGWILALVTGWRSGRSTVEMSAREFDTAIALLGPASAPTFGHATLDAWRALRDTAAPGAGFVVRFQASDAFVIDVRLGAVDPADGR